MNRSLKGEYHKAVINIKSQEKDTPYGTTYVMRHKVARLISDEVEAEELRLESQRLLGTPIPLAEGRPEEEGGPLGYTPQGTPFYSEEERDSIMLQEAPAEEPAAEPEPKPEPKEQPAPEPIAKTKPLEKKPVEEPPVEETETKEEEIPLDF